MSDLKLSIIVCTYNRCEILKYCLDSLEKQSADKPLYEVIVVDNNSTDYTRQVVEEYCSRNSNFRYVFESNQGLSHARNRGAKESKVDWICYLDDDSYIGENFFAEIFKTIETQKFDIFGGVYLPWYKYRKPKWFKDEYASNLKKRSDKGFLSDSEFVDGGIMILKRSVLKESGGFVADLGMKGGQIGYGEETELQIRLRKSGKTRGFNSNILIYHLVPRYKMKVLWFLKSNYKCGKQSSMIFSGKNEEEFNGYFKEIIMELIKLIRGLIRNFKKLCEKDYYWQNYIIDNVAHSAYNLGQLLSFYKKEV